LSVKRFLLTHFPVLKALRRRVVNPRGKSTFIETCAPNGRILDVGCGNDSPIAFKGLRPDLYYVGIDVGDCRQSVDPNIVADEYVVTSPEDFDSAIGDFPKTFDRVVSAHNLEHCDRPENVLRNMASVIKPGGKIYLSFPSQASLKFPSRSGCLNFYDDPTHNRAPDFKAVCDTLRAEGLAIEFATPRYRPLVAWLLGLLVEPISRIRRRVMPGTWALYGFETVIWAARPN
jgi:SAM-dependent methyltransferase